MQVGDLVKWRRDMFRSSAPVGIAVERELYGRGGAWWSILWSNGKTEIVSERNLKVINEAR